MGRKNKNANAGARHQVRKRTPNKVKNSSGRINSEKIMSDLEKIPRKPQVKRNKRPLAGSNHHIIRRILDVEEVVAQMPIAKSQEKSIGSFFLPYFFSKKPGALDKDRLSELVDKFTTPNEIDFPVRKIKVLPPRDDHSKLLVPLQADVSIELKNERKMITDELGDPVLEGLILPNFEAVQLGVFRGQERITEAEDLFTRNLPKVLTFGPAEVIDLSAKQNCR